MEVPSLAPAELMSLCLACATWDAGAPSTLEKNQPWLDAMRCPVPALLDAITRLLAALLDASAAAPEVKERYALCLCLMVRQSITAAPVCASHVLRALLAPVSALRCWPLPTGGVAKELAQALERELASPGSAYHARVLNENPQLLLVAPLDAAGVAATTPSPINDARERLQRTLFTLVDRARQPTIERSFERGDRVALWWRLAAISLDARARQLIHGRLQQREACCVATTDELRQLVGAACSEWPALLRNELGALRPAEARELHTSCCSALVRGWSGGDRTLLALLQPRAPRSAAAIQSCLDALGDGLDASQLAAADAGMTAAAAPSAFDSHSDSAAPKELAAQSVEQLYAVEEGGNAELSIECWSFDDAIVSGVALHDGIQDLCAVGATHSHHVAKCCVDEGVSDFVERAIAALLRMDPRNNSDSSSKDPAPPSVISTLPHWADFQLVRETVGLDESGSAGGAPLPVLRLCALGGDAAVHRLLCTYTKLISAVKPSALASLDLRLYTAPVPSAAPAGAATTATTTHRVAKFMASRDPWYERYVSAPMHAAAAALPHPQPSEIEATLLLYAREAHYTCGLRIFKCMCWLTSADPSVSSCDVVTHFVSRLELGISAESSSTKTPQLDVDYIAAIDGRHASLVCRAYSAVELSCLPSEGGCGDDENDGGVRAMRLRMLSEGGVDELVELKRDELDRKLRADADSFDVAEVDFQSNSWVSSSAASEPGEDPSRAPLRLFTVLVDGVPYGPFSRVSVRPLLRGRHVDAQHMCLPLRTFMPRL